MLASSKLQKQGTATDMSTLPVLGLSHLIDAKMWQEHGISNLGPIPLADSNKGIIFLKVCLLFADNVDMLLGVQVPTVSLLPGAHLQQPPLYPLSSSNSHSNSCTASEAPTMSTQVARVHAATPLSSSNSHLPSEALPAGHVPAKTRALRAHFKATTSAPTMDTMDLAHQRCYYLLPKDPFTSREGHLVLAKEAFSRTFGEKPGSQFEVSLDMLQMVSVTCFCR